MTNDNPVAIMPQGYYKVFPRRGDAMKKFPRRAFLSGGLLLLLAVTGCSRAPDPWAEVPGSGPKVLASFAAPYALTKKVAGDHAQVLCLTTTQEPHDFKPGLYDSHKAKRADLFIVNGLGLD